MINIKFPQFVINKVRIYVSNDKMRISNILEKNHKKFYEEINKIIDERTTPHTLILVILSHLLLHKLKNGTNKSILRSAFWYFLEENDAINDNHISHFGYLDDLLVVLVALSKYNESYEFNSLSFSNPSFIYTINNDLYNEMHNFILDFTQSKNILSTEELKIFDFYNSENILLDNIINEDKSFSGLLFKLKSIYESLNSSSEKLDCSKLIISMYVSGLNIESTLLYLDQLNIWRSGIQLGLEASAGFRIYSNNYDNIEKELFASGIIIGYCIKNLEYKNLYLEDNLNSEYFDDNEYTIISFDTQTLKVVNLKVEFDNENLILNSTNGSNQRRTIQKKSFQKNYLNNNIFNYPQSSFYFIAHIDNYKVISDLNFLYFINMIFNGYCNPIFPRFWITISGKKNISGAWDFIEKYFMVSKPNDRSLKSHRYNYELDPFDYLGSVDLVIRDCNLFSFPEQVSITNFEKDINDEVNKKLEVIKNQTENKFKDGNYIFLLDSKNSSSHFTLSKLQSTKYSNKIDYIDVQVKDGYFENISSMIKKLYDTNDNEDFKFFLSNIQYNYLFSFEDNFLEEVYKFDSMYGIDDLLELDEFSKKGGIRDRFLDKLIETVNKYDDIIIICTSKAINNIKYYLLKNDINRDLNYYTINKILSSKSLYYKGHNNILVVGNFSRKIELLNNLKFNNLIFLRYTTSLTPIREASNVIKKYEFDFEKVIENQEVEGKYSVIAKNKVTNRVSITSIDKIKLNKNLYEGIYIYKNEKMNLDVIIQEIISHSYRGDLIRKASWKRDLGTYFKSTCNSDYDILKNNLKKYQVYREVITLKEWIKGEGTLLPQRGFKDIDNIYKCISITNPYTSEDKEIYKEFRSSVTRTKILIISKMNSNNYISHRIKNISAEEKRYLENIITNLDFVRFDG